MFVTHFYYSIKKQTKIAGILKLCMCDFINLLGRHNYLIHQGPNCKALCCPRTVFVRWPLIAMPNP